MRFAAAIFFALAVVAAQVAHGGLLMPFLAYPAYALVALGALCALPAAFRSPRQPWPAVVVAFIAFFAWVLWRCWSGPDRAFAFTDAALALACAAVWAGMALAVTRNDARFVFVAICLAAGCAQVVVAIIQLVHYGGFSMPHWFSEELKDIYATRYPNRARGLFMNPNQFAWLMNVVALMTFCIGIWGRLRLVIRIVLLYLAAVFGVMTVLSASRGGTVSLLAGFSLFLALSLVALIVSVRGRRMLLLGVGVTLLAICIGAGWLAFSTSWVAQGRLDTLLQGDVRSMFIEEAFRLFQTDPVAGVGPGMFRYAARMYRSGSFGDTIFAHDDWLQFLAEYGLVGMCILLPAAVLALVAGCRGFLALVRVASAETGSPMSSSGALVLGAVCGLAACALHANVDFNMHIPANALLTAALLGLVTGSRPASLGRAGAVLRPLAWVAAAAMLVALAGLGWIIQRRGAAEFQSLQAANALARGNAGAAIECARKGLEREPGDPLLLSQLARGLYEYEAWLEESDPNAPSLETDADIDVDAEDPPPKLTDAERTKIYRESAEAWEKAVQAQPLERTHWLGWARVLAAQENDDDARRKYREVVALDPLHAFTWSRYGDYLYSMDEIAEARRVFLVGAHLPVGDYAQSQVDSIDEEAQSDKEEGE